MLCGHATLTFSFRKGGAAISEKHQEQLLKGLFDLAPTTALAYWIAWLSVQKALQLTPCHADSRTTRLLKARANAYPVAFPQAATLTDLITLTRNHRHRYPGIVAITMLSFLYGQRISDMIQLSKRDVTVVRHRNGEEMVLITVRRGKTIGVSSHPYTLWLRRYVYPTRRSSAWHWRANLRTSFTSSRNQTPPHNGSTFSTL